MRQPENSEVQVSGLLIAIMKQMNSMNEQITSMNGQLNSMNGQMNY